ncbi:conserved hypothetical protein [Trichinella spiralis]|uniref:hypothetical protein n=1 Tax=Trichinella spiralis TaxID=6334 RepID=UPI0001EFB954|nr:conserved hypothetical protein [Trichinella spiralis]
MALMQWLKKKKPLVVANDGIPFDPKHLDDIDLMTPNCTDDEPTTSAYQDSCSLGSARSVSSGADSVADKLNHTKPTSPCGLDAVEEALLSIADEERPLVARSTPKGSVFDHSDSVRWHQQHDMQYCLFDRSVYEAMLGDCIRTCESLKNNLDIYIDHVRALLLFHLLAVVVH